MYIDDVPVPFSYGFGMVDFNNVDSIEVLKGAQGTLFGKGAESGVINIYTKAPSKDFLSFSTKLRYNPNTPLEISLNYLKSKSDDGGSPFKINTKQNPYSIANEPTDDSVKMDSDMLSLIIKYKEKDYTFTSATSYAKHSVLKKDYVGILGGLDIYHDIEIAEITQEFRLKQNLQNAELLLGAFYSDKLKFDYKENQTLLTPLLSSNNSLQNPDENIALFTQYKHYIGENYSVMAGLRYQETKRSFSRSMNNFGAATTRLLMCQISQQALVQNTALHITTMCNQI